MCAARALFALRRVVYLTHLKHENGLAFKAARHTLDLHGRCFAGQALTVHDEVLGADP
jgi:hypothetical protein